MRRETRLHINLLGPPAISLPDQPAKQPRLAKVMALLAFFPSLIDGRSAWLVGASGSIFGVLVAAAMLHPKDEVKLIIPPVWVTVRRLALIFIGLSIASMFIGFNVGGNAAHLGGALFGYLLIRRPWSLDFADPDAPRLEPPGAAGDRFTASDPAKAADPSKD